MRDGPFSWILPSSNSYCGTGELAVVNRSRAKSQGPSATDAMALRWRQRGLRRHCAGLAASLLLLSAAATAVAAVGENGGRPRRPTPVQDEAPPAAGLEVLRYALIVLLVLLSAVFSGLTLGFMSLDQVGLEVVIGAGERPDACRDEQVKALAARRVLPVRKDGNLLLTTLVLGTVAVNSLMSILMADLTSGLAGFLISTIVIVLFGEIIPQSLCSRHALLISARLVPVVRAVILLLYPFSKPISLALDYTLGKDVGTVFSRRELTQLLEIHARQKMLNPEEAHIVRGAMSFKHTKVTKVMVPSKQIFSLPISFPRIAPVHVYISMCLLHQHQAALLMASLTADSVLLTNTQVQS